MTGPVHELYRLHTLFLIVIVYFIKSILGVLEVQHTLLLGLSSSQVLTQDEVEFGVCLESIVEGDEERGLPDGLEDLSLRLRMLQGLLLLDDGRLLQHLHGVQLAAVVAPQLPHQKHFAIG